MNSHQAGGKGARAALDQRTSMRYQITAMDLGESVQYLRHHLALVGRADPLFADDAIARCTRPAWDCREP